MLCRNVIERPERLPIPQKPLRGFWVFGLVGFKKCVKLFLGMFSPFRHPNLMEAYLGLLLKRVRKVDENIGRLVNPALLLRLRLGKTSSSASGTPWHHPRPRVWGVLQSFASPSIEIGFQFYCRGKGIYSWGSFEILGGNARSWLGVSRKRLGL